MLDKLITEQYTNYLKVKENSNFSCKCETPGKSLECISCECFINFVQNIQEQLYKDNKWEGASPKLIEELPIRKVKRYSQEEKEKAIKLINEGTSVQNISDTLGIPYPTIYGWIN